MTELEVLLPKMGESVAEATITKWLKKEGDEIEEEESIAEIATDKVDSEIPSPASGVIKQLLFKEGDVVQVGSAIAVLGTEGIKKDPESILSPESSNASSKILVPITPISSSRSNGSDFIKTTPLVKMILKKEGISDNELKHVQASGIGGKILKTDIQNLLHKKNKVTSDHKANNHMADLSVKENLSKKPLESPEYVPGEKEEVIPMDRMRKLISDHMVMSKKTSPHVTSFVEADVTNLVTWRNKVKSDFQKKTGEKLTFTPMFIEAVVKAIQLFPRVNSSISNYKIHVKNYIHIGMATALPSGNLIVPVLKNCENMDLVEICSCVNDLSSRARIGKLTPDEVNGGTFSISNVGTFGNIMGTPIINQPQVAILAVGAIRKQPVVVETEFEDVLSIRSMMYLSLSYDHRVVDGALGGSFLRKIADELENFNKNREI